MNFYPGATEYTETGEVEYARYVYGKAIKREMIPYENGEAFDLPTQNPEIYLFESEPTIAEALSGDGALAGYSLTSWTENHSAPYNRNYTFPAVNSSDNVTRGYWEAVNYTLTTSGTVHTLIRYFQIEAAQGGDSFPHVSRAEIIATFPAITAYVTEPQLEQFISSALMSVRIDVEGRGFRWERMYNLERLKLAVNYRAVAMASFTIAREDNDRFMLRYKEFDAKAEHIIDSLKLPYDADGDTVPDAKMNISPQQWRITR